MALMCWVMVRNEMERLQKQVIVANLQYYLKIYLLEMGKTMTYFIKTASLHTKGQFWTLGSS